MSEVSEIKTVKKDVVIHKFYCDYCGEYLSSIEECEDGYYPQPYNFDVKLAVGLKLHRNICPKCYEDIKDSYTELCKLIDDLGFGENRQIPPEITYDKNWR